MHKDLYNRLMNAINESLKQVLDDHKECLLSKPIQLYHLSTEYLDGEILKPRIPANTLNGIDGEDRTTPRVCFSSTLAGAYRAIQQFGEYCNVYVYEPENIEQLVRDKQVLKCTVDLVPDSYITDEYWVLCPVKLKLLKKIRIGYDGDIFDPTNNNKYLRAKTHFRVIDESIADFEDYPGELERLTKDIKRKPNGELEIKYIFGKNGSGLSKELIAIGDEISKYSKDYYVTLCNDPHFDQLDDVYDFTICCSPLSLFEGAWGYKPKESDWYWDISHKVTKPLKDMFLKGLKNNDDDTIYSYMGFVVGFIKNEDIWFETIDHDYGYKLYDAFEDAYEKLSEEDYLERWSDPDEIKKELDSLRNQFRQAMKKYIGTYIPKQCREIAERPIDELQDGTYIGKHWACYFKVKDTGKVYYVGEGPRCKEEQASWKKYKIKNGKIRREE